MSKIKLHIVEIFYGHRCNLSCQGCSSVSDHIKDYDDDPSLESIFESIENLSKSVYPKSIDLMGGELFLYWDRIKQIIPKIREHFPKTLISMTTNGMLLEKHADEVVEISKKYHPCVLEVTNHFTLFPEDSLTDNYKKKIENFVSKNNFVEKDKTEEEMWDKTYLIEFRTKGDETYENENMDLHLTKPVNFYPGYFKNEAGKLKPFATNDPEGSYEKGCSMPVCHLLLDNKLYKCSWFAFLPRLLKRNGQEGDPDWDKYLGYKPLDLENADQQDLIDFYQNSNKAISLCDMCSNQEKHMIKHDRSTVLPE